MASWRNRRQYEEPSGGTMGPKSIGNSSYRNQQPPAPRASFDSEESLDSPKYDGSPNMSDDMHEILSPSFDSANDVAGNVPSVGGSRASDHSAIGSSYSADSIVRRVEEEIAAARKAASNAKTRINDASFIGTPSSPRNSISMDRKQTTIISSPSPKHPRNLQSDQIGLRAGRDPSPDSLRGRRDSSIANIHNDLLAEKQPTLSSRNDSSTNVTEDKTLRLDLSAREPASPSQSYPLVLSTQQQPTGISSDVVNNDIGGSEPYSAERNQRSDHLPNSAYPRGQERNRDVETRVHVTDYNSDDDMHDILGVDDNDDEKKSAVEPYTGNNQRDFINQKGRDSLNAYAADYSALHNTFDNKDYLHKKANSSRSQDENAPDRDIGAMEAIGSKVSPANDKIASSPSNISNRPSSSTENNSRTDVIGGSATGAESIYFTDEEWQVDDHYDVITEGSKSRCATPCSQRLSSKRKVRRQCDSSSKGIDATLLISRNGKEISKNLSKPVETDPDSHHRDFSTDSDVSSSNQRGERLASTRTEGVLSDTPPEVEPCGFTDKTTGDNDFPILETSSTEDAIVSVQHHPVFQKRVSASDSVVGNSFHGSSRSSKKSESISGLKSEEVIGNGCVSDKAAFPSLLQGTDAVSSDVDGSFIGSRSIPAVPLTRLDKVANTEISTLQTVDQLPSGMEHDGIAFLSSTVKSGAVEPNPKMNPATGQLPGAFSLAANPTSTNPEIMHEGNGISSDVFFVGRREDPLLTVAGENLHHEDFSQFANDTTVIHKNIDHQVNSQTINSNSVGSFSTPQNIMHSSHASPIGDECAEEGAVFSQSNNTICSEWDKASELLFRLKEQRETFSANFSSVHTRQSEIPASPNAIPKISGQELLVKGRIGDNFSSARRVERASNSGVEDADSSVLSDGADEQNSSASVNLGLRSPRYFNFMRVKRAKQRARKMSSTCQTSTLPPGVDSDISYTYDEESCQLDSSRPPESIGDSLGAAQISQPITKDGRTENPILPGNASLFSRQSECESLLAGDQIVNVAVCRQQVPALEQYANDHENIYDGSSQANTPGEQQKLPYPSPENKSLSFSLDAANRNRRHISPGKAPLNAVRNSPNCGLNTGPMTEASTAGVEATKADEVEDDSPKHARRIRFRNPFPIVKPPLARRDADCIIKDNLLGIPDLPIRWVKPKKELRQLIVAAMGTSLARRSNACGALKVLTRHKKNQMTLVRTDGFLTAVTFAVTQTISSEDRDLALDARTRAVASIRNVCAPKDNRVLILKHPGVVESLVHVVEMDAGEGRALAAGALALLAKTPCCREAMAQVEGLVDILSRVLNGGMVDYSTESVASGRKASLCNVDETRIHSIAEEENESNSATSTGTNDKRTTTNQVDECIRMVDSIRNQAEEKRDEYVSEARASACAVLLHLSKHCSISHQLCTNAVLLDSLVYVSNETASPLHCKCLEIICNLTRFPVNNGLLTRYSGVIETLVGASNSSLKESRLWSLRSLQNMSSDPGSKSLMATSHVLTRMISCAMRKDAAEKEVAVATIYNISTEPSAVAAITNTKNVVATLVHLAHSPDSSSEVRLLACEALSTISLWLQTLAGTGKVPHGISNVPLPSQKTSGWQRWE